MARSMIARQNIKLNLVPGGVPPVLNVSQDDSAYDVHFTIYNGAQLFEIPDDVSIQFQETKRDGNGFVVGATKSAQTGQCYIWMQEQMSAVPGDQICELVLTNTTGDQIGTANFIMRVEPAALDKNTVISDSEIAYARQVLAQLGSVAAYKEQLDAQGDDIDQLNTALAAEVAARQAADNTLQSNINSEASTRATADAALQSQINQLIAPEGAAPSAAEIENARVGADGTVYPTLGDAIRTQDNQLKYNLEALPETTGYPVIPVLNWTSGIQISNSNGAEISNASYKATDYIAIDPTFGNVSVEASYSSGAGDTNKNAWYDESKAFISAFTWSNNSTVTLTPPPTARYMRLSARLTTTIQAKVLYKQSIADALKSAFDLNVPEFIDGYYINYQTGAIVADAGYKYVTLPVNIFRGGKIKGTTGVIHNTVYGIAFYDDADIYISGDRPTTAGTYVWNYDLAIPKNASFVRIPLRKLSEAYWINPQYEYNAVFENLIGVFNDVKNIKQEGKASKMLFPDLRNGTLANTGNANAISTQYIIPLDKKSDYIEFAYLGDVTDGDEIGFMYTLFRGATDGMTSSAAMVATGVIRLNVNHNLDTTDILSSSTKLTIPIGMALNYDHIAVGAFKRHDGIMSPLRIATDQNNLLIRFGTIEVGRPNILDQVNHSALNARHAPGNPALLTLLHISDLHHDAGGALDRIMEDAEKMRTLIDDRICTGDMVANTAEQITSWWDSSVMTCIGNHETASYNASTGYNWTALSMADRDAYYIAPFESGWGITHTSGTSYYYKDYSTQKVRLIVMDAMLYSGTPGAEAETQTAWLANLLSDAVTNNLHVLIAIHAPHGGATAKECSFSRYGQGVMPTYSDCNTPDVVIQTVATALSNGLHFIGYIVGHTHQDNIWDAEGDGSQLMYCVTCAAVNNPNQWKNSDQYRGVDADAYNLVTIDTTNTLVKIVRGGGADIDDHMRTRKAICFNYTTGEIVGQVL